MKRGSKPNKQLSFYNIYVCIINLPEGTYNRELADDKFDYIEIQK